MNSIKFNQQGIKAILNGSKTMTRRPLKEAKHEWDKEQITPKYRVGETVFVQEEFIHSTSTGIIAYKEEAKKNLRTDLTHQEILDWQSIGWQQNSEMQEHQARIFLNITNIKVERLQDISEEDCIKEGLSFKSTVIKYDKEFKVETFKNAIWNNIPYKEPYDWNSNPYVFVYEFEVIK